MTPPDWAAAIVDEVCADAGVVPPRLAWRRRSSEHSTGLARRDVGVISVRAGADPVDQHLTLLHELAHWLSPAPPRQRRRRTIHHGRAFYAVAFDLYRRHGIPEAEALRLESGRYRSALRHAAALGIPGASAALDAHRAAIRVRPRRRWRVLVPEHPVRLQRQGRWTVCATCGQRVVGANLVRIRRARQAPRHVLMSVA